MHPTNLQLVLILFASTNLLSFVVGLRRGRKVAS